MLDRQRQKDELLVLQSIFNDEELKIHSESGVVVQCDFIVKPQINSEKLTIKYAENSTLHVKYLFPITLRIYLPENYPSESPPDYQLEIPWLSQQDASKICRGLDDLWLKNINSEIIFVWVNFVTDTLNYLNYQNELDFTSAYGNSLKKQKNPGKDDVHPKVVLNVLINIQNIRDYDSQERINVFRQSYLECNICFEYFCGMEGVLCRTCDSTTCKACMKNYFESKMFSEVVTVIKCTGVGCSAKVDVNVIKDICPKFYDWYLDKLLVISLNTMENVVFCPRKTCSYPVFVDDESLATCSKCQYHFCRYCLKGYHGVESCKLNESQMDELISVYHNGTKEEKMLLQKKYGRQQIQRLIEESLTKNYLKTNTKACPRCTTVIEKVIGCNKMHCLNCEANFCWLCESEILSINPYFHYVSNNKCYGQLFRDEERENEYTEEEIMYNIGLLAMVNDQ